MLGEKMLVPLNQTGSVRLDLDPRGEKPASSGSSRQFKGKTRTQVGGGGGGQKLGK